MPATVPPAGDIPIWRSPSRERFCSRPDIALWISQHLNPAAEVSSEPIRLADEVLKAWQAVTDAQRILGEADDTTRREVGSKVDHVDAAPGDGYDQALVSQDPEGFLGGPFGNPVLLGDALDRRHRLARRDLTGSDHLAQDSGELQVGRLPGEMINGHLASVGIPWQTWVPGAP